MTFKCDHPETSENTYVRANGWMECRTCRREASYRRWKARQKSKPKLHTLIFNRMSVGGLDTCWLWRGRPNAHGYGSMKIAGKTHLAHRLVYEWLSGPIPEGRLLHHTCETPLCVNPEHLVPVTQKEHQEAHDYKGNRAIAAKLRSRTYCPHGHPFDEENTAWTKAGTRKCRACDRERYRRRAALAALEEALS